MSEDNKKHETKEIREPAPSPDSFGHKESGQIEPNKAVQAPLPSGPAHQDDD